MGQGEGHGEGHGEGKGDGKGKSMAENCAIGGALCLAVVIVIISIALFGLSIAKIVVGAINIDDCPKERLIPIFLIVSGCTSFFLGGLYRLKPSDDEVEKKPKIDVISIVSIIGFLFNFAWLICGSVWVFPNYSDVLDDCPGETDCCPEGFIKFALAVIIIDWLMIGLIFIGVCCLIGCLACGVCFNK